MQNSGGTDQQFLESRWSFRPGKLKLNRFLHPLDFPLEGEGITFYPKEPGTPISEPDEIKQRRQALLWETHSDSHWNQLLRQQHLHAMERLGLDPESLGMPRGGG